jgi:tetraacyldisaccharide 4'-kinase
MPRSAPQFWQHRGLPALALLPLSALFAGLAALRRALFRCGIWRVERLPVPVVVVGNIAVGGSGKTPVTLWLAEALRAAGRRPGIVSRGYGGRVEGCAEVPRDGDPAVFGDEPLLMALRSACPVFVGRDRPAAARALLAAHPDVDVLLADDGLQHYRLGRDLEIIVVDEATLGNRLRLPAGPLREGMRRLAEADVILTLGPLSSALSSCAGATPRFEFSLAGVAFERLARRSERRGPAAFRGLRVCALAGIGRPERFFTQMEALGLDIERRPFPDHHVFVAADVALDGADAVVMTEKDAVKCAPFAPAESWIWPVGVQIAPQAAELIVEKLDGSPTA